MLRLLQASVELFKWMVITFICVPVVLVAVSLFTDWLDKTSEEKRIEAVHQERLWEKDVIAAVVAHTAYVGTGNVEPGAEVKWLTLCTLMNMVGESGETGHLNVGEVFYQGWVFFPVRDYNSDSEWSANLGKYYDLRIVNKHLALKGRIEETRDILTKFVEQFLQNGIDAVPAELQPDCRRVIRVMKPNYGLMGTQRLFKLGNIVTFNMGSLIKNPWTWENIAPVMEENGFVLIREINIGAEYPFRFYALPTD